MLAREVVALELFGLTIVCCTISAYFWARAVHQLRAGIDAAECLNACVHMLVITTAALWSWTLADPRSLAPVPLAAGLLVITVLLYLWWRARLGRRLESLRQQADEQHGY